MTLYEKCQQAGDTTIHDEYIYIGTNGSGTIELPLSGEQIKSICTQGPNGLAVENVTITPPTAKYLEQLTDEQLHDALEEYGNWSEEELSDREANMRRLVWTLAWDIFDSENPNEALAADEYQLHK